MDHNCQRILTIRFYVNQTNGHIEYAEVLVKKKTPPEGASNNGRDDNPKDSVIPSYEMLLIISSIGILALFIMKRREVR